MLAMMKVFANRCGLHAYLHVLREDYVDTVDGLSFEAINGIGETLHSYKMEYSMHGRQYKIAPTAVYQNYLHLIYLPPDDCQKRGFNLMTCS
jgi:hypothetical protein